MQLAVVLCRWHTHQVRGKSRPWSAREKKVVEGSRSGPRVEGAFVLLLEAKVSFVSLARLLPYVEVEQLQLRIARHYGLPVCIGPGREWVELGRRVSPHDSRTQGTRIVGPDVVLHAMLQPDHVSGNQHKVRRR
eukprot:588692-Prymnesium_polylepis.1